MMDQRTFADALDGAKKKKKEEEPRMKEREGRRGGFALQTKYFCFNPHTLHFPDMPE